MACSIIGATVALSIGDRWIMGISAAILFVGLVRVVSALLYKKSRADCSATKLWERVYEYGAWGFSALIGMLCWLTISETADASLQMIVTTTSAGYAAAIAGRNAGRPFIALGQLALCALPMAVALLIYPNLVHKALGIVVLMFIYGMVDITLCSRDVIIQALTMTRKEAALAARFEEQATRFDVALNNMSHGLCMLDQKDRLQVWNGRFLELLNLEGIPIKVGTHISRLLRYGIKAGKRDARTLKMLFRELARSFRQDKRDQIHISPDGKRTLALSRRLMSDGGAVVILEDVTDRRNAQERIAHLAKYDDLTGLANRAQFHERIGCLLAEVDNKESQFAIHLIDLDRFKSVNDTLGHPTGDKLLRQVAHRLGNLVGPSDTITRFGGDEFVILQAGAPRTEDASWLAQRIGAEIGEPFDIDGQRIDIGASIGIAMAPADGRNADELLKKADMALYSAKNSGRGKHCFFAVEMEAAAHARRALELDLREALASGQFQLYFQPLVDLNNNRVAACEALLRWFHPRLGEVPPSIFIPVAEETGLIVPIGEWVITHACAEAAAWPNNITVAVNLSPMQFKDNSLTLHVASALAKSGLPASRLEVEITERVLLEECETTLRMMGELQELGVSISLDDFGTGYSSLNYLRKFPFYKIKIDQSFTRDLGQHHDARPIVEAIASLGVGLDKIVVAEGIETEQQMRLARAQGCHQGQGHFFGPPMSGAAIREWLAGTAVKNQLVA
ncbi:MAG TPA: EAL domain-containing protein [Pseudolabrys sp.]|nr:EAL domain-containing protein [Pseudolabrys sp.]